MSLSGALNTAATGLSTTQTLSRVTAGNVSNALTDGYVRREAVVISGGVGQGGAIISEVRREVNSSLARMSRTESGKATRYQAVHEGLRGYTAYLGQPGDGTSPADKFATFQSSLTTLVNLPSSVGAQSSAVLAADDLARNIREAANQLTTTQAEVDMEIRYAVTDVNQALYRLAELNVQQKGYEVGSAEAIATAEESDKLLDQIATYTDIRVSVSSSRSISVYTVSGAALLEGDQVQDLAYNQGTGTITAGAQDITPFKDGVRGLRDGALVGLTELKREIVPRFQLQLDEFARGLIETFEGADASLGPGQAGLFTDGGAPLDLLNTTGLSSRIAVNERVSLNGDAEVWRIRDGMEAAAPGDAADSTQVETFLSALSQPLNAAGGTGIPASVTVSDYAAEFVTSQATEQARAEANYFSASSSAEVVQSARRNAEGVNIDDEMQKLLLIEQSFTANSRVLTTVSEMIDTLLASV
ncbi:MAG: flagellar hook-associated protein FlgK [Rhodobacteraceae bacterium]|nr:flagellar hook-associated protein FlgK [Paracoccaceae bacterium]